MLDAVLKRFDTALGGASPANKRSETARRASPGR
jgi:hypothetical protein